MSYPVAVAPSVKTPGAYLAVNLLAGSASPGTGALRALLIGPSAAGATLADDTLRESVAGFDEVATLTGNAPVAFAAKAIFKEYGLAAVDLICPPEPVTVAASATLTFAGTPTVTWTYSLNIHGRIFEGSWTAGTTHIDFADQLRQVIAANTKKLMVTATDDNAGILTITFKTTGTLGNDVRVIFSMTGGTTGTVDGGTALVSKFLTLGTGAYDPDDSLAVVAGREYHIILAVTGNTDVNTSGASTIPAKVQAHIDGLDTGTNAKLQQQVLGFTGSHANAITAAGYRNHGPTEIVFMQDGLSLPLEWAAAEAGARIREEAEDPAVNRIGMAYEAELFGPYDPVASMLTDAQLESALAGGVTPVTQSDSGVLAPKRPVTTYHLDTNSNADDRLLDVSRVSGTYAVARDLRVLLPQTYPGKKLIRDLPLGSDPPGPTTIQEKNVRTTVVSRVSGYWGTTREVVDRVDFDASVTNGEFICQVNDTDESQLDLVIPFKIIKPLAKFSIVVNHVGP